MFSTMLALLYPARLAANSVGICLFCLSVMSAVHPCNKTRIVVATGDLKLAGPLSTQVRMLLEENAALQVIT